MIAPSLLQELGQTDHPANEQRHRGRILFSIEKRQLAHPHHLFVPARIRFCDLPAPVLNQMLTPCTGKSFEPMTTSYPPVTGLHW